MNKPFYTLVLLSMVCGLCASYPPPTLDDAPCKVYVPNVFSPNEDGVNDVFKPEMACNITAFDLQVFNRWGQLVFASDNPEVGWNGTAKGELAPATVYVYRLEVSYEQEGNVKKELKTGDVALVR